MELAAASKPASQPAMEAEQDCQAFLPDFLQQPKKQQQHTHTHPTQRDVDTKHVHIIIIIIPALK